MTNLKIIPWNIIHVVFKVDFFDNHHMYAMSIQKLVKIQKIHEDNEYNFLNWSKHRILKGQWCVLHRPQPHGVYQPCSNPVVILAFIDRWRIKKILVDEGSASTIIYTNYWRHIDLNTTYIIKDTQLVSRFDDHKSHPF